MPSVCKHHCELTIISILMSWFINIRKKNHYKFISNSEILSITYDKYRLGIASENIIETGSFAGWP